eukprot:5900864-Amphidinium_carterae.1
MSAQSLVCREKGGAGPKDIVAAIQRRGLKMDLRYGFGPGLILWGGLRWDWWKVWGFATERVLNRFSEPSFLVFLNQPQSQNQGPYRASWKGQKTSEPLRVSCVRYGVWFGQYDFYELRNSTSKVQCSGIEAVRE